MKNLRTKIKKLLSIREGRERRKTSFDLRMETYLDRNPDERALYDFLINRYFPGGYTSFDDLLPGQRIEAEQQFGEILTRFSNEPEV